MPDVRAGRHEERLARRHRIQADTALRAVRRCSIGLALCALLRRLGAVDEFLVLGSVEGVEVLLPAAVDFDADLDAAEDHFFAAFEVDAELD